MNKFIKLHKADQEIYLNGDMISGVSQCRQGTCIYTDKNVFLVDETVQQVMQMIGGFLTTERNV